jgi:hypothetical protein
MAATPWLFFVGIDIGKKLGCKIKAFFFSDIYLYDKTWRITGKVVSICATILCLTVYIVLTLIVPLGFVLFSLDGRSHRDGDDSRSNLLTDDYPMRRWPLLIAPFAIAFIEKKIQANNLDMSNSAISVAGQLIPSVVGAYILFTTIMALFKPTFLLLILDYILLLLKLVRRESADVELGQQIEPASAESSESSNTREEQARGGEERDSATEIPIPLLGNTEKKAKEEIQERQRGVGRCKTL